MKTFFSILLTFFLGITTVTAKEYRLIINGGPGSSMDSVARILGNNFSQKTNHSIIYEYQSGGNAFNAANAHLNGPPSLLLGNTALFVMNHVFNESATQYKDADFNYVGLVTRQPILWYTNSNTKFSSPNDYIAQLKNSNVNDGIGGEGLFQKLNALILINHYNLKNIVFVPYKSSNEILTNVLGGTHSIGITSPNPTLFSQIKAGKIILLGSTWPGLVVDGKEIPYLKNTFGPQLTGLTALTVSKKFNETEQKYLKEEFWKIMTSKNTAKEFSSIGVISDPIQGEKLPYMFDELRSKLRFYKHKFNMD